MPILLDRGRVATDDPTLQTVGGGAVLPRWSCPAGRDSQNTLASLEKRSRVVGLALRPESRPKPRRPSTCV
jgi:hypothetical protein